MSKSLSEQPKIVNNVVIVRHGEQLLIPETMTMEDAVELLERRIAYDAQEVAFSENFEVFPWDGANALDAVLTERYGWAPATATSGARSSAGRARSASRSSPGRRASRRG